MFLRKWLNRTAMQRADEKRASAGGNAVEGPENARKMAFKIPSYV